MLSRFVRAWILGMAVVAGAAGIGNAAADSIVLDGVTYQDVLVYEGGSLYYVKLPREGRVISTPKSEVNDSSVSINPDPFYRDELKALFDRTKERVDAGEVISAPTDPAFAVPDRIERPGAESAPSGPATSLGINRQQIESALPGWNFTEGIGASPDGFINLQLIGPPDNLTQINATITAPQAQLQQLIASMTQLNQILAPVVPWAGQWIAGNQMALMQGQPISTTQNGVFMSIQSAQAPPNITVNVTVRGA